MELFNKSRCVYLNVILSLLVIVACNPQETSIAPATVTSSNTPVLTIHPTIIQEATSTLDPYYRLHEFQNISISPDGEMMAVSAIYGMRVYDLNTKSLIYSYEYDPVSRQHTGSYTRIAWSSNNQYLAIGTLGEGVRIWRISPWDLETEILVDTQMAPRPWTHPGFEWSPDGNQLVLSVLTAWDHDEDRAILGRVLIWDSASNTWENIYDGEVINVTWWDNGQIVIMLEGRMVDITSGDQKTIVESEHFHLFSTVVWSPDERYFCHSFEMGGGIFDIERQIWIGKGCYPPFAWSIDGRYFATIFRNTDGVRSMDTISIWNSIDDSVDIIEVPINTIFSLAWSPQDELFALGVKDESIYLWNNRTDEIVLEIE